MASFKKAVKWMKKGKKVYQKSKGKNFIFYLDKYKEHIMVNDKFANFCHIDWFDIDDWKILKK